MGIKGLWPLLSPIAESVSLHSLAVERGFVDNISGSRLLRVGVDASAWIYSASFRHGQTRNPELASLFLRCGELFQLPILPVFVFDGPARAGLKRGKQVRGNAHWITSEMKEMLEGFGFPWIEAPGEAEAELAWMSRREYVDVVLSDDSDTMVFGATTVLTTYRERERGDHDLGTIYNADAIYAHDSLRLNTPGLILIALLAALLAGGDYSPGVHGCGIQTAHGLARAGLGMRLVNGIDATSTVGTCALFLATWRRELCQELCTNRSGCLRRCLPQLANIIPADFPSIEVINLYRHPVTSEHEGAASPATLVVAGDPNLSVLGSFAERHFMWGHVDGILRRFSVMVFPGFALRELINSALSVDIGLKPTSCPSVGGMILKRAASKRHPEARVNLTLEDPLIYRVCATLSRKPSSVIHQEVARWIAESRPRAWLPLAILDHVCPQLQAVYEASHPAPFLQQGDRDLASSSPELSLGDDGDDNIVCHVDPEVIDLTSPSPSPSHEPVYMKSSMVNHEVIDLTLSSPEP